MSNYLKELMREELEFIDSGRIQFLIYPGGAGGEFMTIKICEHSNDNYYQYRYTHSKELNRYKIHNGFFHNTFCESLINSTIDILDYEQLYSTVPVSLQDMITAQYEDRVNQISSGKNGICRTHIYHPCMNSSNAWYLYPDTDEMKSYTNKLSFIKRFFDKEKVRAAISNIRNQDFIDEFLRLTSQYGITELEYFRVLLALNKTYDIEQTLKMSFDELFNLPEVKRFLSNKTFLPETILEDNNRIIRMSQMTTPGYIEEKFNITNDTFNKEVLNWHNLNLELIEKYKEYL